MYSSTDVFSKGIICCATKVNAECVFLILAINFKKDFVEESLIEGKLISIPSYPADKTLSTNTSG
jgi:hypothetical protein